MHPCAEKKKRRKRQNKVSNPLGPNFCKAHISKLVCAPPVFFSFIEKFAVPTKREFSDSRFPEDENSGIRVFHKTRILGFSFSRKGEFSDSRFPQNKNSPILFFHKRRILQFSFSIKPEFSVSHFPQNENSPILESQKTRILGFPFSTKQDWHGRQKIFRGGGVQKMRKFFFAFLGTI